MLCIGFMFYIIGFGLIVLSFTKDTINHTIQNWKNTNCIIHGALSITGLALCISMESLGVWLIYIWLVVSIIFCIVECIELIRSIIRVKLLGVNNGLFVYHPTQWARNFTFGMYVNFTIHLPDCSLFENARYLVVDIGKYIVVILFVIEIGIFMNNVLSMKKEIKNEEQNENLRGI